MRYCYYHLSLPALPPQTIFSEHSQCMGECACVCVGVRNDGRKAISKILLLKITSVCLIVCYKLKVKTQTKTKQRQKTINHLPSHTNAVCHSMYVRTYVATSVLLANGTGNCCPLVHNAKLM